MSAGTAPVMSGRGEVGFAFSWNLPVGPAVSPLRTSRGLPPPHQHCGAVGTPLPYHALKFMEAIRSKRTPARSADSLLREFEKQVRVDEAVRAPVSTDS
jgi:hypothetical protein